MALESSIYVVRNRATILVDISIGISELCLLPCELSNAKPVIEISGVLPIPLVVFPLKLLPLFPL